MSFHFLNFFSVQTAPSDSVIPDPTKCYYRGNFYENGEEVPVEDVCSASCRCHAESAWVQVFDDAWSVG